jgi:hypothetical protein
MEATMRSLITAKQFYTVTLPGSLALWLALVLMMGSWWAAE